MVNDLSRVAKSRVTIALLLILSAGSLRFFRLGDWPFAGDELASLAEEQALFSDERPARDSRTYRLARLIPLSYFVHHVGNTLFGRDEFGSRVAMAVFGTVGIGAIFVLLDTLKGRATAVATTLLVTLWPEHLFNSQNNRYYIVVFSISSLCMLVGVFAAQRRSTLLSIVLCGLVGAAVLCHTLMASLLGILLIGVVAGAYADRRPVPGNVVLVFLVTGILLVVFFLSYVRPLMAGWYSGADRFGYGVLHSVLGSINMVGWPVALLAMLGLLLLLQDRSAQNWYWIVCALGWGAATIAFPLVVWHHPSYVFPLATSIFVLAGCAVGTVYEALRAKGILVAGAWVGLACLGNFPSLVSHYVDGSRSDMRSAAQYVQRNWQVGDRISGYSMGLFGYYSDCRPAIPLRFEGTVSQLTELSRGQGRLWVVLQSPRAGLPADVARWLGTHCSREFTICRRRFDYAEYSVDVFLHQGQAHPKSRH